MTRRIKDNKYSKEILDLLLEGGNEELWYNPIFYGLTGHHKSGDMWIAWDNRSGDCFVEEFKYEWEAIKYIDSEALVLSNEELNLFQRLLPTKENTMTLKPEELDWDMIKELEHKLKMIISGS